MTERHNVFVSYHDANDQESRKKFEEMCEDVIVSQSVDIDDIDQDLKTETIRQKIRDEYLRDSTVTVVLIGKQHGSENMLIGRLDRAFGRLNITLGLDFLGLFSQHTLVRTLATTTHARSPLGFMTT